jgi:hypothetical protein
MPVAAAHRQLVAGGILMLIAAGSCRNIDVVTASYATLADARNAGAIGSTRIPDALPPGTREIREARDLDTNRRWGLFMFPPEEGDSLRGLIEAAELNLDDHECDIPSRIEWWPVLLRGSLDAERIHTAGLRVYGGRRGDLVFAVNWNQGRAYYWTKKVRGSK